MSQPTSRRRMSPPRRPSRPMSRLPGDGPTEEAIVEPTPEPPRDPQGPPLWLILFLLLLAGGILGSMLLFLTRRQTEDAGEGVEGTPGPPDLAYGNPGPPSLPYRNPRS